MTNLANLAATHNDAVWAERQRARQARVRAILEREFPVSIRVHGYTRRGKHQFDILKVAFESGAEMVVEIRKGRMEVRAVRWESERRSVWGDPLFESEIPTGDVERLALAVAHECLAAHAGMRRCAA